MSEQTTHTGKLTSRERATARLLRFAPWLAFFLVALPAPLLFLLKYFSSPEEAGVWMLITLSSLAVSSFVALCVVLFLLFYRSRWEARLRERLAADGITAGEVEWFRRELTSTERRALKEMDARNPLLADAYRETLAARLTASRVLATTRRETAQAELRLQQARGLQGAARGTLERDLRADRDRLERISREAAEHKAEAETRLRMIEAEFGRGRSEADTARALERLGQMRQNLPLALENARLERELQHQLATSDALKQLETSSSVAETTTTTDEMSASGNDAGNTATR